MSTSYDQIWKATDQENINRRGGGDSINLHYSRLKKLWDELNNYTQLLPSAVNSEILGILTKEKRGE